MYAGIHVSPENKYQNISSAFLIIHGWSSAPWHKLELLS